MRSEGAQSPEGEVTHLPSRVTRAMLRLHIHPVRDVPSRFQHQPVIVSSESREGGARVAGYFEIIRAGQWSKDRRYVLCRVRAQEANPRVTIHQPIVDLLREPTDPNVYVIRNGAWGRRAGQIRLGSRNEIYRVSDTHGIDRLELLTIYLRSL
jgi:hypothetical protein